ncbi:MAG: HrcA family transcriptional regulator, partial [Gaiellaceae bacterium]
LEDPTLSPRERRFLDTIRPVFADLLGQDTQLFVGGAASMLGEARGEELEACQRLLEVLERRAAVLGLLQDALDPKRTVVRVGPELEGEELQGASYVGATYGLQNRSLGAVGLLGPLRMDYEKAIRSVRGAAQELSRFVEEVYEDN